MRLIDADESLRTFTVTSDGRRIPEKDCDNFDLTISLKEIKQIIKERPTAYDVDKVVEQLEELKREECTLHECGIRSEYCKPCIAKKAIEIVKAGGIDGN